MTTTKIKWNDRRLPESFWSKAERRGIHWVWKGGKFVENGYGRVKLRKQTWRVHRLVYTLSFGEPSGQVLHRCDIRLCFNPDCLFTGTHRDNMVDMMAKGRSCRGDRNHHAKLTEDDVIRIRILYLTGEYRQQDLAERFGVHQTAISHIVRGASWKHLYQDKKETPSD